MANERDDMVPAIALTHIDAWIEDRKSDDYAAWVFNHFRLPAILKIRFEKFMAEHKLFCDYDGKRYRVTGASRLGDVWLATDFNRDCEYDRRVDVALCSGWSPTPKAPTTAEPIVHKYRPNTTGVLCGIPHLTLTKRLDVLRRALEAVKAWLDEQDRMWTSEARSAFLTSCQTSSKADDIPGERSLEDSESPSPLPTGGSKK